MFDRPGRITCSLGFFRGWPSRPRAVRDQPWLGAVRVMTKSSGPPCPAKLAIASAVAQPLDGGRLLPLIVGERPDPGRVHGRRRLVDEIGFRFRRHGDGGNVGRDALLLLAPCASAALRAASCSRSMPVLRGCP